jgi:hypothetical protein
MPDHLSPAAACVRCKVFYCSGNTKSKIGVLWASQPSKNHIKCNHVFYTLLSYV